MTIRRYASALACAIAVCSTSVLTQSPFADSDVITGFSRAVDAYAFRHRQVERRSGPPSDRQQMASALRASRPEPVEGEIFTPLVSAAFRARLAYAVRRGCRPPEMGESFTVPARNEDAGGAMPIAECLIAVLPRLPAELEYRARGVALLLVDTHADIVVDILHAAFAPQATP